MRASRCWLAPLLLAAAALGEEASVDSLGAVTGSSDAEAKARAEHEAAKAELESAERATTEEAREMLKSQMGDGLKAAQKIFKLPMDKLKSKKSKKKVTDLIKQLDIIRKQSVMRPPHGEESGVIAQHIGFLHLMIENKTAAQEEFRDALEVCGEEAPDWCRGTHQAYAQTLILEPGGAIKANAGERVVREAVELYEAGARLIPDSFESYSKLGQLLSASPSLAGVGKKDKAAKYLKVALEMQPDANELSQLYAVRLSQSTSKKNRLKATKLAESALELKPSSARAYMALGTALANVEPNPEKVDKAIAKAGVDALRTAVTLSDAKGTKRAERLDAEGRAEAGFLMGKLLANNDPTIALRYFEEAHKMLPTNPKYFEARNMMHRGVDMLNKQQNKLLQKKLEESDEEDD